MRENRLREGGEEGDLREGGWQGGKANKERYLVGISIWREGVFITVGEEDEGELRCRGEGQGGINCRVCGNIAPP